MLRSFAFAVCLLATVPLALAQEAAPAAPVRPWQVTCVSQQTGPDLVCSMGQTLLAGQTGQRVVSANITRQDGKLVMQLALPHGLRLPDGVDIAVDGGARSSFTIVTADQNGSYAEVPLDDALLGALRAGQILEVVVQAYDGGEIVLQLSLAGFTEAIGRL
ncbi:invasion associated locus B family protein [Nostoc sp. 3335mG]|nr:invasion associated locus B family protein [Nostoc sp. 3335mG]